MKKSYSSFFALGLTVLVAANVSAQNRLSPRPGLHSKAKVKKSPLEYTQTPEFKGVPYLSPNPTVVSAPANDRSFGPEVVIGQSFYDLQTNSSVPTRILNHGNGTLSAIWTFSNEPGTPWSDRGMAYHFFDGTNWVNNPNYFDAANISRIEPARTGFGAIGRITDVGDIVIAHRTDIDALQVSRNPYTDATQNWNSTGVTEMPFIWPRMAVGGPDGKTVHAIGLTEPSGGTFTGAPFNGINGALLYNRSTDGGATWTETSIVAPGVDSTIFSSFSGDSYAIDARGNTVAFVAGETNSRVMLWKSTDNGVTWDSTQIWSFPYEPWDDQTITDLDGDGDADSVLVDGSYIPEAIDVSDGNYAILIDNNDQVHVWFGLMRMSNDDTTDDSYSYYPGTSGMLYWNESFGLDSLSLIADIVDDDGDNVATISTSYAAIGSTAGPVPYGSGLTLQPSAGIDANGTIYLTYSGAKEGLTYSADGTEPSRKHIYITKSSDGGASWLAPTDLVGDESAGFDQLNEYVYCSMARRVDGNVHLVYQRDYFPGSAVTINNTSFHPFDIPADIVYLSVPADYENVGIAPVKAAQFEAGILPNPANEVAVLKVNTEKSANVRISIHNMLGQTVDQVANTDLAKGKYQFALNTENLKSGIYLVNVQVGNESQALKLVVKH
ncbi:MAG: T9SS type A sorting domain-containing protein [Bacteroidia bacterium]